MYGMATMYEDYSSKALRLSDTVPLLSQEEVIQIFSNITLWLNFNYAQLTSIWKSDATQAILYALDNECWTRMDVLEPTSNWKLTILICKLQKLFRCIQSRKNKSDFLAKFLTWKITSTINSSHGISEMKQDEFVLLMCLVSVLNSNEIISENVQHLQHIFYMKILMIFDDINSNELSICYTAMKQLDATNIKELETRISDKYGFRF
jgi:hypothetical protein